MEHLWRRGRPCLHDAYHFAIDGDQLTIDMISDDYTRADYGAASPSEAELLSEQMAQTAIYETSPFTRQP